MRMVDKTGLRYGRLVVVRLERREGSIGWVCHCDCGNKDYWAKSTNLNRGRSGIRACGCNRGAEPTHGMSATSEFKIWCGIIKRCCDRNAEKFPRYGGRGIRVCKRWLNSFANFFTDMGKRPSRKHSIDRKNNNGDYTPTNCRWVTGKVQANNRSPRKDAIIVEYQGERLTLREWSKKLGISLETLRGRHRKKRPLHELFSPKLLPRRWIGHIRRT